jgi:eukaryotic-like serine/threonine-protein kinase
MEDPGVTRRIPAHELKTALTVDDVVAQNYRILGRAGAGGMGVVYRARDLKLERIVALKFLPPGVAASEKDKERFLKEARIASSLDHPNIGAIYGIDEAEDGRTFIVMAFYEGQSLADRIRKAGRLEIPETIDTAVQMAKGLEEAHSRNIVHRDIKPSNVMLTGAGLIKIVDFGLAHAIQQTATASGSVSGTLRYMAPEQALNKAIDQRVDIWALGVVMMEMLTGKNPFERDSMPSTLFAILNDAPPALDTVPVELQSIVYRALSKDPVKRYPNCSEVLRDLDVARTVLTIAPGDAGGSRRTRATADLRRSIAEASRSAWVIPAQRSRKPLIVAAILGLVLFIAAALLFIGPGRTWLSKRTDKNAVVAPERPVPIVLAVLPFPAIAGDARLSALGQGLTESVAAKLANLAENHALEVIAPRSLQEKGLSTLTEARRQLGATIGLTVNMEQTGELVKVTYSLSNAQSGSILGENSITVPAADIFSAEDNVAEGAVKALKLNLLPEEATALKLHGTTAPAAYKYYLQARGYLVDYTKLDNVENAILMNGEALKLDPNFGIAKAGLGEAYWRKYAITKDKQWTGKAKAECDAAVSLGNAGSAGHICLGLINAGTGLYREAALEFQRAVELEPGNESAAIGLASALEHQGAVEDAGKAYQRVVDAHPQSYFAFNALGGFYYRRSEYQKAIQMFQKVTELAPEGYVGYLNLGGTYNDLGRFQDAIEPLKKSVALRPSYGGYTNLGTSYFGLHKLKEAAAAYQEAIKLDPNQYVTWGNLAAAQYYGGSSKESVTTYRKAVELATAELKVNPHDVDILSDLAQYESMLGDRNQALAYLGEAMRNGHGEKDLLASAAQVYNQLGETGLALEWMSKAIQAGYSASKFKDLPAFQNLAGNLRYQELIGNSNTH